MPHDTNDLGQPIGKPVPNWQSPALPGRESFQGRFSRLEPVNPDLHAQDLYQANSLDTEGRIWTYLPYGPFATFEEYNTWLGQWVTSNDPLFFAIIDQATKKAVGLCSYLRIDPRPGSIEVGHLSFSPLLQATPVATEAMYLMMERAFELGYRRYEWKCHSLNAKSRRAAQRFGLSFEGVFRQAAVYKGRNRDTAWYAAIDEEWPAMKAAFQSWLAPANFDPSGQQKTSLSTLTDHILNQRG